MSGPGDLDAYRRLYPGHFKGMNIEDVVILIFIFILPFLIAYVYVRFIEDRLLSFNQNRLTPFIKSRIKPEKLTNFIWEKKKLLKR